MPDGSPPTTKAWTRWCCPVHGPELAARFGDGPWLCTAWNGDAACGRECERVVVARPEAIAAFLRREDTAKRVHDEGGPSSRSRPVMEALTIAADLIESAYGGERRG